MTFAYDICHCGVVLHQISTASKSSDAPYAFARRFSTAVRQIDHQGEYFTVSGPYLCEPSPQRTPFLFQGGTFTAGRKFAATNAEAIFLNGHTPELVRPSVDGIREVSKSRICRKNGDVRDV